MRNKTNLLRQLERDFGFDIPFVKGQKIIIKNCWHFSTDGNSVSEMFYDDDDFKAGMNRVFIVLHKYNILILAFCLMDTHVHFLFYGEYDECNRFMHDFINRTSQHIAYRHGDNRKLEKVRISHQPVEDDFYFKVVVCYIIKNPPVAGMNYLPHSYPWSSGSLYFASGGSWVSPLWSYECNVRYESGLALKRLCSSKEDVAQAVRIIADMVFPGEYVEYKVVEKMFHSCKAFNYIMSMKKEDDVDSRGGYISNLSIPISEMRQHKNEICLQLFGHSAVKNLNTQQRLKLARALKAKYNSSDKQIIRICGLFGSGITVL